VIAAGRSEPANRQDKDVAMSTTAAPFSLPKRAPLSPVVLLQHSVNLLPLVLVHMGALAIFWTGSNWYDWVVLTGFMYFRGMFQTVGYHRYFSHRSFKTTRWFQFLLGFCCCTNLQQGPLWWAVYHRHHHKHSDHEGDPHSPFHGGFWWAYCGWLFVPLDPNWKTVSDLAKYRELVWLERLWQLPGLLVAGLCFWIGGWSLLCVGFCLSAVVVFHLTFAVNTFAHLSGERAYETTDQSRNNVLLGILTLGDGWHNNHHRFPHAAQAGIKWWQVDRAFRVICFLEKLGIVWNVRRISVQELNREAQHLNRLVA
jgi:stearoyl-CoA desaturase (delta-9 desaturase)